MNIFFIEILYEVDSYELGLRVEFTDFSQVYVDSRVL